MDLELSKPIKTLAGDTVTKLHFDFDALKPSDYRYILRLECRLRGVSIDDDASATRSASSEFRIATAWMAAVSCADNKVCLDDIENLSMRDLLDLEKFGLFFIAGVE